MDTNVCEQALETVWLGTGEVYLSMWTPVSAGRHYRRVWLGTEEVYVCGHQSLRGDTEDVCG